jgi:anti-anti-sigma factor
VVHSLGTVTADRDGAIQILDAPGELDLATADGVCEQGRAAIARHARLVLFDLTGMYFCDARGLSAFVRVANDADAAGCGYGLIAPQPPVARILRITGLDKRLRTFATIDEAVQRHTAVTGGCARLSMAYCT